MRFGLQLESSGLGGDPRVFGQLAHEAEMAGWDGIFISDPGLPSSSMEPPAARELCDTWVTLAAIGAATERMRIGTLLTPLARYRPWELALRAASIDHLSGGRLSLIVGAGNKEAFARLGEDARGAVRVSRLREALEVLAGLWTGEPFSFKGEHFALEDVTLTPRPLQTPRVRVIVAAWGLREPVAVAASWDGVHITHGHPGITCPERGCAERMRQLAAKLPAGADIVIEGLPGQPESPWGLVEPFADAGVTWWLETVWWYQSMRHDPPALRARIQRGPPRRHAT